VRLNVIVRLLQIGSGSQWCDRHKRRRWCLRWSTGGLRQERNSRAGGEWGRIVENDQKVLARAQAAPDSSQAPHAGSCDDARGAGASRNRWRSIAGSVAAMLTNVLFGSVMRSALVAATSSAGQFQSGQPVDWRSSTGGAGFLISTESTWPSAILEPARKSAIAGWDNL
jgi:hypothetical protein